MLTGIVSSRGFLKRLDDVGSLPVWSIDGSHLPDDMLALLDHLLDLGGTYGDPEAGDPVQYDELRMEHDQAPSRSSPCPRSISHVGRAPRTPGVCRGRVPACVAHDPAASHDMTARLLGVPGRPRQRQPNRNIAPCS